MFLCSNCNEVVAKQRRCGEEGFNNVKKPFSLDEVGMKFNFCPGKATWFVDIVDLYESCRVAMETGILPERGTLGEQDELFVEVFPTFVDRWKTRTYQKIWADVGDFANIVLKSVANMLGAKTK